MNLEMSSLQTLKGYNFKKADKIDSGLQLSDIVDVIGRYDLRLPQIA